MLPFIIAALPTFVFWIFSYGFCDYYMEVNNNYNGKVTVQDMVKTQLMIDFLQFITTIPRIYMETDLYNCRPSRLLLGIIVIECVEYFAHRLMHTNKLLWNLHKTHHRLVPVHTLGSYYNSIGEVIFTGSMLGFMLIYVSGLSLLEVAIVASLGSICTIMDHCPTNNGKDNYTRHEIHHNININTEYGQPFSGVLDDIFGTRYYRQDRRKE